MTISPTVSRLRMELRKSNKDPSTDFVAGPVNDDLLLWHFTIKGPKDTPFEGGIYHGEIFFPFSYPLEPPDIVFLTPNGRFEVGKKICLTVTSYHPDSWQPAWDARTLLTSLIAFMPTEANGAIGAIDESDEVRAKLAIQSHEWHCNLCDYHIEPDPFPFEKERKENTIEKNQKEYKNEIEDAKNKKEDNDINDRAKINLSGDENDLSAGDDENDLSAGDDENDLSAGDDENDLSAGDDKEKTGDEEEDNNGFLNNNISTEMFQEILNDYYDYDEYDEGTKENDFFDDCEYSSKENLNHTNSDSYDESINEETSNSRIQEQEEEKLKHHTIEYSDLQSSIYNHQHKFIPFIDIPIIICIFLIIYYTSFKINK